MQYKNKAETVVTYVFRVFLKRFVYHAGLFTGRSLPRVVESQTKHLSLRLIHLTQEEKAQPILFQEKPQPNP